LSYYAIKTDQKLIKDEALSLLTQVGLTDEFFNRFPHQLSGGQRQRVVIARALASKPELLICDESVAALDISVQAQVLNLLNQLKKELGLSYLFISHDLAVVKYMSDRVMVMKDGQLVELQEADKLYAKPQSQYTKKLIEAIPN
jgi:peptide/nickel transport system ATP-binding protein